MTDLFVQVQRAKELTASLKELKEIPEVQEFLTKEKERKSLHRVISETFNDTGMDAEAYKELGLIESKSSWVKVSDVETLAKKRPFIRKALLALINTRRVFYTR